MKYKLALVTLVLVGSNPMVFADEAMRLEKAAEKNEHKADKQEHKAEIDVAENKTGGAQRHARKAAVDEIKSEKEIERVQTDKKESLTRP